MSKQTFAERCQLAQQLLPDAQYRAMLTALHDEMLAALAEQPAQQEPVAWMSDRAVGFKRSEFGATPTVPLYTTPQAPAQPSKPTKWLSSEEEQEIKNNCTTVACVLKAVKAKLYTTPQPPAQPLTDAQIFDLAEPFGAFEYGDAQGHKRLAFARAIEAAHGITKGNT